MASTVPNIFYRVRVGGKWSNEFKNLLKVAGTRGKPITDIAIKVSYGSCKYRVHVKNGNWLPWVTGYNINDYNNGYAGSFGKSIDRFRVEVDKFSAIRETFPNFA